MALIKRTKVPEKWDAETAKIIEQHLSNLYASAAPKYSEIVTAKPNDKTGQNGQHVVDSVAGKVYWKINGQWKEIKLS